MHWHPMIIKWCLHLKVLSSAAYHAFQTSRFITLPSERTLPTTLTVTLYSSEDQQHLPHHGCWWRHTILRIYGIFCQKKTPTFKDSPMTGILSEIRGLENRKDPTTYSPLYTAVTIVQ